MPAGVDDPPRRRDPCNVALDQARLAIDRHQVDNSWIWLDIVHGNAAIFKIPAFMTTAWSIPKLSTTFDTAKRMSSVFALSARTALPNP